MPTARFSKFNKIYQYLQYHCVGKKISGFQYDIELFLDHEVEIFWKFWGSSHGLENTEDLGSSQVVRLTNTVGISEMDTNE